VTVSLAFQRRPKAAKIATWKAGLLQDVEVAELLPGFFFKDVGRLLIFGFLPEAHLAAFFRMAVSYRPFAGGGFFFGGASRLRHRRLGGFKTLRRGFLERVGQVLATNPAHSVRRPKHVVRRGKTPVLTAEEARQLLDSIDTTTLVGLRDRAVIGVMTYAFARIGAVVAMRVEDYYPKASAGGCGCARRAASGTRCPATITSKNI
jgi:integrase